MDIGQLHDFYYNYIREFIGFCKTNDLRIYPVGGTLLGIVKYSDFIPWDDDVDFTMPREDYERLFVLKDKLTEFGISIKHYTTDKKFKLPYMKLVFRNHYDVKIDDDRYGFHERILPAFDIYPLDNMGNECSDSELKIKKINKIKKLYEIRLTPINKFSGLKKVVRFFFGAYPMSRILKKYDQLMAINIGGGNFVTRWRGPDYEKHIYRKELWYNTVPLSLRGFMIDCPMGYKEILEDVYGNFSEETPVVFGNMRHGGFIK